MFLSTTGSVLALGRPLAYLIMANTIMLLSELRNTVCAPDFRIDDLGLYKGLVDIWLKKLQETYFRLSREKPQEGGSARLATHSAAYIFWLRGSAPPLQTGSDSVTSPSPSSVASLKEGGDTPAATSDNNSSSNDDEVYEEDLVEASLAAERLYRQARLVQKGGGAATECTMVDLHSFLVSAGHALDSHTLQRDPKSDPAALPRLETWHLTSRRMLGSLRILNSAAVNETCLALPKCDGDDKEKQAEAVLALNERRIGPDSPSLPKASSRPPEPAGLEKLFDMVESSYRHAWFEFLKRKYRSEKLTFDTLEAELPKLLRMLEAVPAEMTMSPRPPESAEQQQQILQYVLGTHEANGYPSQKYKNMATSSANNKGSRSSNDSSGSSNANAISALAMPSLLDMVPGKWDDVGSDVTHEALLDVVEGMFSRMQKERIEAAAAYGRRAAPHFWESRAGHGRPTKHDMAIERERMLRHVGAVATKSSHDFLHSLGFTRYRLSLCIHRFSQSDPSRQLWGLASEWEKYLKSREHYNALHSAFLKELSAGRPKLSYLQPRSNRGGSDN
jgi:hypothetical protein